MLRYVITTTHCVALSVGAKQVLVQMCKMRFCIKAKDRSSAIATRYIPSLLGIYHRYSVYTIATRYIPSLLGIYHHYSIYTIATRYIPSLLTAPPLLDTVPSRLIAAFHSFGYTCMACSFGYTCMDVGRVFFQGGSTKVKFLFTNWKLREKHFSTKKL